MLLKYVTITGADENTEISEMLRLTREYPYVEWGILVSVSMAGKDRYPQLEWMREMISAFRIQKVGLNLSMHLCGKISRELISGKMDDELWKWYVPSPQFFQRIQINCNIQRTETFDAYSFASMLRILEREAEYDRRKLRFIVQQNRANQLLWLYLMMNGITPDVLFDASGGRGKDPSDIDKPISGLLTGYSGGLNPENVSDRLNTMQPIVGVGVTWIDMETGVRDENNKLSIEKVENILQQCKDRVL